MRLKSAAVLLPLAVVGCMNLCHADPVSIDVCAGAAAPKANEKDIRMVCEDLSMRIYRLESVVKADMRFLNEGPAQEVLVGFPQLSRGTDLEDLRYTVDGDPVECEHLPARTRKRDDMPVPGWWGQMESWYVARVPFEQGQERRIVITYRHRNGMSASWKGLNYDWLPYILFTGAHWKGTVERIDVTVEYGDFVREFAGIEPKPAEHDEAAHRIRWHFEDYDGTPPTLVVRWRTKPLRVLLQGEPSKAYASLTAHGPILDVGKAGPELGIEVRGVPNTWLPKTLVSEGRELCVRTGRRDATLGGEPFKLTRAPVGLHSRGWAILAAVDLKRAFGIDCTYDPEAQSLDFHKPGGSTP